MRKRFNRRIERKLLACIHLSKIVDAIASRALEKVIEKEKLEKQKKKHQSGEGWEIERENEKKRASKQTKGGKALELNLT